MKCKHGIHTAYFKCKKREIEKPLSERVMEEVYKKLNLRGNANG